MDEAGPDKPVLSASTTVKPISDAQTVSLHLYLSDKIINFTSVIGHYTNKVTEIKHRCRTNFFLFW